MNNILDKCDYSCTGCGVCSKACPKSCIKIKREALGFYRPNVNDKYCSGCGICKRVCYKFFCEETDEEECIENTKAFLSYSTNDYNREKSSSGGIAREIAFYALKNSYMVCGAEYDYKEDSVKHCIINNETDVDRISGSKYLPSFTEDAFNNIDSNKRYIVFGTPCQIYGLRKYMDIRKIDNMILVDFFCHGTPTLNLWNKYLEYLKEHHGIEKIKNINFRDKTNGWHNFSIKVEGENRMYCKTSKEDMFFDFFLLNLCLMNSCAECRLRFNKIYSDIRIADFWGPKCVDDEKGSSLVLVNTKKGKEVFEGLNNIYYEDVTFDDVKRSQYVEKLNIPKERTLVMKLLETDTKIKRIHKYALRLRLKENIRIRIIYPLAIVKKIVNKII